MSTKSKCLLGSGHLAPADNQCSLCANVHYLVNIVARKSCHKKYIVIATTEMRLELNIPIDRGKMYGKLDMYKKGMKVMPEITYDTE